MARISELSARDLIWEMRLTHGGAAWDTTMEWWFAVAGEMYERGLPIPHEWKYRPSPLGAIDRDQYEARIVAEASDTALILFGCALSRYASHLKESGQSY